ncbi:unnamed protein product [Arabidopsis lyrata]|nr:unnamed protein product [Arabidopsis lyrata]
MNFDIYEIAPQLSIFTKLPTTFDIYEIVPKLSIFRNLPHNFRFLNSSTEKLKGTATE